GDAARVEDAVPHRRLERRRLPQLERVRWLDVEVAVDENSRGVVPGRGPHLADGQRAAEIADDLGFATGGPYPLADPPGRAQQVARMLVLCAHARDAQEFRELVEPVRSHAPSLLRAGSARGADAPRASLRGASTGFSQTGRPPPGKKRLPC